MTKFLACLLVLLGAGSATRAAVDPGAAVIPRMEYEPLAPGSYRLERIQDTPDARLLDTRGRVVQLRRFLRGRITLLTFFYTYCVDPLGCPYSHAVLRELREALEHDPALLRRTRFVSVSFDPGNDTPAAIERYAKLWRGDARFEWRFLTAPDVPQLLPLLEDMGQDVSVEKDAQGRPTRTLHHMLKMFLVDESGTVREIYTLAFLQPAVILNDIRTLALESAAAGSPATDPTTSTTDGITDGPGIGASVDVIHSRGP